MPLPANLPGTVEIDGEEYHLRQTTPTALVEALGTGCWWSIVPQLLTEDSLTLLETRLTDPESPVDMIDLWQVGTDAGGALAGTFSWWAASKLCAVILTDWLVFDAWCVSHGIDALSASLHQLVAGCYAMLREGRSADEIGDLDMELFAVPWSMVPQGVQLWSADDEASDFARALSEQA